MAGTRVEVVEGRSDEWMVAFEEGRSLGPFACRPAAEQAAQLLMLKIDGRGAGGSAGEGGATDDAGSWEDGLQGVGLEELITILQEHAEGSVANNGGGGSGSGGVEAGGLESAPAEAVACSESADAGDADGSGREPAATAAATAAAAADAGDGELAPPAPTPAGVAADGPVAAALDSSEAAGAAGNVPSGDEELARRLQQQYAAEAAAAGRRSCRRGTGQPAATGPAAAGAAAAVIPGDVQLPAAQRQQGEGRAGQADKLTAPENPEAAASLPCQAQVLAQQAAAAAAATAVVAAAVKVEQVEQVGNGAADGEEERDGEAASPEKPAAAARGHSRGPAARHCRGGCMPARSRTAPAWLASRHL